MTTNETNSKQNEYLQASTQFHNLKDSILVIRVLINKETRL